MRRILFPALGVVVLLFAYAGQELAAGAPSAPRASAQASVRLLEMGDAAKVLKYITAAEIRLLEGLFLHGPIADSARSSRRSSDRKRG